MSHLLQMRGLKPVNLDDVWPLVYVASFTDAWIETETGAAETAFVEVASFTDAWIETGQTNILERLLMSHLLQMRGLKPVIGTSLLPMRRRIFYRCVD